jgi:hypothetical protein
LKGWRRYIRKFSREAALSRLAPGMLLLLSLGGKPLAVLAWSASN